MTIALPDHCTPTEQWLVDYSSAFGVCVPTNIAFVSTTLGICSIISWLFAQMPQIYKNYKLQSASGLSIYFLSEWLLGDLTNLLGCLLTDQAAWQIIVAVYYVTVDVCLVTQYVWYAHAKPWRKARIVEYNPRPAGHHDGPEGSVENEPPRGSKRSSVVAQKHGDPDDKTSQQPAQAPGDEGHQTQKPVSEPSTMNENFSSSNSKHTIRRAIQSPSPSPRVLLLATLICVALSTASPLTLKAPPESQPTVFTEVTTITDRATPPAELAGRLLSWTSTLLYLFSRLPQIYKNAVRRSTSGLSPTLFIAAFFGNLFYSTSILANPLAWSSYPPYGLHGWVGPDGNDRITWVSLAAPFWLGAAGVLVMDAVIGVQFLVYGEEAEVEVEVLGGEDGGKGRWKRVTGWMRGWVPSPPNGDGNEVVVVLEREGLENGEARPLLRGRNRSIGNNDDGGDDDEVRREGQNRGYGGTSSG